MSTVSITDIAGIFGVIIIIIAYILLQLEKIDPKELAFSLSNTVGAFFIILSLIYDWNLASFIMESTWMIVSFYGVWKYYKARDKEVAPKDDKKD